MTVLDKVPYMAANARAPYRRECVGEDGRPKASYPSLSRARAVIKRLGEPGLQAYVCGSGQVHIGHGR